MLCCRDKDNVFEDSLQSKDAFDAEKSWKAGNIYDEYTFVSLIGQGGNANVWKAQHKKTKAFVAIKISQDDRISCNTLGKEFIALKKFKSPHIISPRYFFYGRNHMSFMVTDMYASDLCYLIEQENRLNDDVLRSIVKEIGTAVQLLHERDLVHRDIKPDNIFVSDHKTLVLGDFGSIEYEDVMTLHTMIGTLSYSPPEVLVMVLNSHASVFAVGKPADVFSLGLTLYAAATGNHLVPDGMTMKQTLKFYEELDVSEKIDSLDRDEAFKDLLYGMLDYSPIRRLTISEVLKHRFVTNFHR